MSRLIALLANWPWRNLVLAVMHTLWQGPIILALLWILLRTLPARRGRLRYLASLGALVGIVLAAMVTWSVLDRGGLGGRLGGGPPAGEANRAVERPGDGFIAPPAAQSSAAPLPSSPQPPPVPWTTWAGWAWACGAGLMLFRTLAGAARAQRWAAQGELLRDGPLADAVAQMAVRMRLRRPIRLLVHGQWAVPAVMGFVWPTLLLPAAILSELSVAQLQMVLAHELAHIRRWDYLVNFCQQVVEAILFFNPAVWWVSRQVRVEREACCDAWAVRVTGAAGEAARTLAGFAQRFAEGFAPPTAALTIGGGESGSFLDRIKRIVRPDDRPAVSAPWYTAGAAIAGALICLGMLRAGADVAVTTAQALLTPAQTIEKIAQIQKSQEPAADAHGEVEIRGTVRTADGSPVPVRGINAQSRSAAGSYGGYVNISPDGTFRGELKPGEITMVLYAKGFAPAFAGPFIPDGKGIIPPVRIVLERGFTAPIRVVDRAGKPVAGAEVSSVYVKSFWVGQQKHTTDLQGTVSLEHSTAEVPIQLDVTAGGFEFERQSLTLTPGKIAEVVLAEAKPVTGSVEDLTTGKPIANATISLIQRRGFADENHPPPPMDFGAPPLLATTDANGKFGLSTLRADCEYVIWVSAAGHGSELFRGIRAGEGGLAWRLGPERVIRGRITGDVSKLRGTVHIGYEFQLSGMGYGGTITLPLVVANGVGTFELRDPAPGYLTFDEAGNHVRIATDKIPSPWELNLDPLHEAVATRTVVLKFDLPDGAPPPRGRLRVWHLFSEGAGHGAAAEYLPVVDGVVRYAAPAPGKVGYVGSELLGYWTSGKSDIDVPAGDGPFEVHVPVVPAGAVHGVVLDSDGKPTADYFYVSTLVMVKSPALPPGESGAGEPFNSHDSSGKFLVSPLPLGGRYRFAAKSGDRIAVSDAMSIDAQTPIREVTLRFVEGTLLRVTVVDADGRPHAGVAASLEIDTEPSNAFGGVSKSTGRDGVVVFEHLNPNPACKYLLKIAPGTDYAPQQVAVQIDGRPVTIILAKGLALRGQVIDDKTGQPVPNVKVTALPQYRPSMPAREDIETFTDNQGNFAFANLDQYEYTLQVDAMAEADAVVEHLPGGGTRISYPNGFQPTIVHGGEKEPVIVRVQPTAQ